MINTCTSSPSDKKPIKDRELIVSASSGNRRAQTILYTKYAPGMQVYLQKHFRVPHMSPEDLLQGAWMKIFSKLDTFSPMYAFSTRAYRILFNHCIDELRKVKRYIPSLSIDASMDYDTEKTFAGSVVDLSSMDGVHEMIYQECYRCLREAFEKVYEHGTYKEVMRLRYEENMRYTEIGDQLSVPLGTVKAQLFRGRELLVRILQKTCPNKQFVNLVDDRLCNGSDDE